MKTKLALATLVLGLAAAPVHAATISVAYSEDFTEKLEDEYGLREGERLAEFTEEALVRAFDKRGVDVARVDVVIQNAKPNRPTFEQLRQEPGLDFGRSISIGGADLKATLYDADGGVIGEVEYDWFENDIRDVIGAGTWTDARRATRRFADRVAKSLAEG